MTNVYRGRWDGQANPKAIKEYPIASADVIDIGDLMWWDRANSVARVFSHANAWTGSLAGSRGKVAENFLGSAMSAHVANDANVTTVRIAGRSTFSYPVGTAATFEIGDLVTADQDGSDNLLLAQSVEKLTGTVGLGLGEPSLCIGKVAKRDASSASTVEIEFMGINEPGGGIRALLTS